ncbi:hypothetical protein UUU_21920 [Klebsiella pneumoniae subsp. pneumoniae DSM 30104 = JCM 1662 = NBRC 14940]|nr:hypothetical protein UUU_21920 [Klebsiella pneumoniae subsp. pneumoniae DSM 30104 = JCM 1662 = NBRC 14940]
MCIKVSDGGHSIILFFVSYRRNRELNYPKNILIGLLLMR